MWQTGNLLPPRDGEERDIDERPRDGDELPARIVVGRPFRDLALARQLEIALEARPPGPGGRVWFALRG